MPTISTWQGGEGQPDAIAEVIGYKSVSTGTITRGSSTASAVTIRLETLSGSRVVQGENGRTFTIDAFALAEYGTDLKPGDMFTISSQMFQVEMILPGHTDCVQAMLRLRR